MVLAACLGQDVPSSRVSMLHACVQRVGTKLTNQPLMNQGRHIGSERPLSEGLTLLISVKRVIIFLTRGGSLLLAVSTLPISLLLSWVVLILISEDAA